MTNQDIEIKNDVEAWVIRVTYSDGREEDLVDCPDWVAQPIDEWLQ